MKRAVAAWVQKKFKAPNKLATRKRAWPGLKKWQYVFVHGVVKDPAELQLIAKQQIEVIPFYKILIALEHEAGTLRGGAGTDISEIIQYFATFAR
jgi:hypothetical protein